MSCCRSCWFLCLCSQLEACTCRGVFETEAEAEDFALNGDERLWALVVFKEGPSAAGADYTIRHNFTTVPTTWVTVNKYRHSVPIDYKVCCTCQRLGVQGVCPEESGCPEEGHASHPPVQHVLERDTEAVFQAM